MNRARWFLGVLLIILLLSLVVSFQYTGQSGVSYTYNTRHNSDTINININIGQREPNPDSNFNDDSSNTATHVERATSAPAPPVPSSQPVQVAPAITNFEPELITTPSPSPSQTIPAPRTPETNISKSTANQTKPQTDELLFDLPWNPSFYKRWISRRKPTPLELQAATRVTQETNNKVCPSVAAKNYTSYHKAFPFDHSPNIPVRFTPFHIYQRWKVFPFALGGAPVTEDQAITISTQLTEDRLDILRFLMIPERWPGRVSACYYAASTDEAMVTLVRIANMWPSEVLARLDLHVVRDLPGLPPDTERGGYPINFLRNVAWNYVRTPYVFLLDIDFMPSLGFLEKLPKQLYHSENAAIAWVAVTFHMQCDPAPADMQISNISTPPANVLEKGDNRLACKRGAPFKHIYPTQEANYMEYWFKANRPYQVPYRMFYEPYIIGPTRKLPRYDEIYGYANDKVAQMYEVAAANFSFVVMPHVWLEHIPHKPFLKERTKDPYRKFCETVDRVRCETNYNYACFNEDSRRNPHHHYGRDIRKILRLYCHCTNFYLPGT